VRPVLEVVQRPRSGQPRHGALELGLAAAVSVGPAQGHGVPGWAGSRGGLIADGDVVDGEAPGDGLPQRRRFDHHYVAVCLEMFAQLASAIGGIAEDG
jgi:hypothetical protein